MQFLDPSSLPAAICHLVPAGHRLSSIKREIGGIRIEQQRRRRRRRRHCSTGTDFRAESVRVPKHVSAAAAAAAAAAAGALALMTTEPESGVDRGLDDWHIETEVRKREI